MSTLTNGNQIAEKSILDVFGRQTYLGNSFILPVGGMTVTSATEKPLALITCPSSATKALFLNYSKVSATGAAVINSYYSPTALYTGPLVTPIKARPGLTATSIAACYLNPSVAAAVAKVRRLVFTQAGSFYDVVGTAKAIQIFDYFSEAYYFWFNVTDGPNTQTAPVLSGTAVQVDVAMANSAAQVATAFYTAVAAVTDYFTATNTPAGTVTVTNIHAGNPSAADSVTGTAAALTTVTAGVNLGSASYVSSLSTLSGVTVESKGLTILDPGYSVLLTAVCPTAGSADVLVYAETGWYEI